MVCIDIELRGGGVSRGVLPQRRCAFYMLYNVVYEANLDQLSRLVNTSTELCMHAMPKWATGSQRRGENEYSLLCSPQTVVQHFVFHIWLSI